MTTKATATYDHETALSHTRETMITVECAKCNKFIPFKLASAGQSDIQIVVQPHVCGEDK